MRPRACPRPAQEDAFLRSVIYASLFDYPVTLAQLREGLIGEAADELTLARWYDTSEMLQACIEYADGHFFPRGRSDLLDTRRRREAVSRALLREWQGPLSLIRSIPFVRMVALSGSLAHLNADSEADLDLFVITRPGRVWSVAVSTLILARVMGWRKRLCLNYIVSERALMVSPADLFSANQIVHLQPLCGEAVYHQFLDANRFVERFYPNFCPKAAAEARNHGGDGARTHATEARNHGGEGARTHATETREHGNVARRKYVETLLDRTIGPLYERVCRTIYTSHLKRRAASWRSRDQVRLERECLKLHTSSHRREVMERFERAVEATSQERAAPRLTLAKSSPVRAVR
jgi:hypothetical protein